MDTKRKDALAAGATDSQAANSAKRPAQQLRPNKDRPLVKLSVQLIHTYKHINEVWPLTTSALAQSCLCRAGLNLDCLVVDCFLAYQCVLSGILRQQEG
jgi:hypothetical protein